MAGRGKRKGDDGNGFADWGGYMAAKISKLENQYSEELNSGSGNGKISNILSGVAIFVNGYTSPSAEELKRIMLAHGGIYHHYYNPKTTTHIIASNLCDAKIKKLRGDEKFVKPDWIVDSLKSEVLLDVKPYLLYTTTVEKGQQKLALGPLLKKSEETVAELSTVETEKQVPVQIEMHKPTVTSKRQGETKRAGEDDFLSEFYNRSRLHHISTMGAHFKRLVSELRENSDGTFPGMEELDKWKETNGCSGTYKADEPVLMHIDMDCFFVSVGLRNRPELRGKPVVVTHARADSKPQARREGSNRELEFDCYREHWIKKSKFANEDESASSVAEIFPRLEDLDETCSMSEIASASYEARAAGIYNGMFMGGALKLCPNLVAIPYDFEGYQEVATSLYNTVASYTVEIEAVSCDEMYADITSILRQSGLSPTEFATHLKEVIFQKTQCHASVGMGPNMLIARLATKKAKPNGLFYMAKTGVEEFMKSHKVDDLPGVGRSMAHRLHAMGVQSCAEMQQVTLGKLQHEFGQKQGQTLYHMCRGEDKRVLKTGHIRKSISADVNYGIRFTNEQEMYKFAHELATELSRRMEEIHVRGRLLTLKLKIRAKDAPVETAKFMGHGVCDSLSRSTAMTAATRDADVIHREVMTLLRQLKVDCCELRGMGVQMTKLVIDNAKGKQLNGQKTLLNFVVSKPVGNPLSENVAECDRETPLAETADDRPATPAGVDSSPLKREESETAADRSLFELPSASQIDSSVLDQLPDDLKSDIFKAYQRKGVHLSTKTKDGSLEQVTGTTKTTILADPPLTTAGPSFSAVTPEVPSAYPTAGPSSTITTTASSSTAAEAGPSSRQDNPMSYGNINQISDIDASFWSALPDDIKAEIERDIVQRKTTAPSPTKNWTDVFRTKQPSPSKISGNKPMKRKANKAQASPIKKVQSPVKAQRLTNDKVVRGISPIAETAPEIQEEDVSLGGATTLPEIRQLLIDWFSSTDAPEDEDCDAVSNYLVKLVNHRQLDKVEPIILFLKRWSSNKNENWRKVVEDIINHAQLYVIQHYNAPLKLPSAL